MRIVFEDGVCEDVDGELVAGDRFRLLQTPVCSSSVAKFGDVVELTGEGDIRRFQRVAERSSFETLELSLTQEIAESAAFDSLLDCVLQAGGRCERAFGGMVLIHVPAAAVDEVKARIGQIGAQRTAGS